MQPVLIGVVAFAVIVFLIMALDGWARSNSKAEKERILDLVGKLAREETANAHNRDRIADLKSDRDFWKKLAFELMDGVEKSTKKTSPTNPKGS